MSSLPLGDIHVEQVNDLIRWLSSQSEPLHLRQADDSAPADLPADVARNFEASGYRALYSLPLMDDQGRVGLLLYESSDPDFLDLPHTEMIKILAGQATVAIRNALLYREVPLISLLEPLMHKKQAMLRSSRSRRLGYAAVAVAVTTVPGAMSSADARWRSGGCRRRSIRSPIAAPSRWKCFRGVCSRRRACLCRPGFGSDERLAMAH